MRFFATTATVLMAFASAVYGLAAPATTVTPPPAVPTVTGAPISGGANPIRQPLGDAVLEVEKPFTIKWDPNYGNKVKLTLRKGDADNLEVVIEIAETENTGSYTWTPPKELKGDDDYSIQIVAGSATNYSPRFTIRSGGVGIKSSTTSSATASTKTASSKKPSSAAESDEPSGSASILSTPTRRPSANSTDEPITAVTDAADNAAGRFSSPLALALCIAASLVCFY